jgi:PAS domain S-box-containing protein
VANQIRRYIAGWIALAAAALALGLVVLDVSVPDPLGLGAFVLGVAVAERIKLHFRLERADIGFTLIEVPITAGLVLLAPGHVVLGAMVGMGLAHGTLLAAPSKITYNVAQTAVATSGAALVLHVTPPIGPLVAGHPVLGVLGGMTIYTLLNLLAMVGLLNRLLGGDAPETLREQLPLTAGTILGSTAVGIVLAGVWTTEPALVPFLLAPVAAIHLAGRGSVRAANLLEATRAEHMRLERVVDGASDGILLLDQDGVVQVWNPAMETMTGLPSQLTVGRSVDRVLTSSVRMGAEPIHGRWLIDEAHEGAAVRDAQARLRHVDGSERVVVESHSLVFDDRGRCTGDVVVVRDVTRQEELERLRSDFVARVSHELRTPLTPIRGFASVLLRRGEQLDADQRRDALERIVERADHLGEVVEDLLLVTRVDRREVDDLVSPMPGDLVPVVEEAVAGLRASAPDRPVTLNVAPGVPPALADAERTRQILQAVLDNAERYTPDGTPIEVEVDHDADDVRVRIIDHGPGIPREHRDRVFEQFQRLENPLTMSTGGVGLGLFLSRRLAEAMHGSLELALQVPGRGCEMVLRLPTAEPMRAEQQVTPENAAG